MEDSILQGVPEGLITETNQLAAAPLWRREPYRLLFPLGVSLAWAGISHWWLHAAGLLRDYRPVFHAMTQIQGFMTCMAVGFLFTMIPRRTGSRPPEAWEMVVALIAPIVTTIAAWHGRWVLAQVAWLVLAATIIGFAVRRFLGSDSGRRPPNAFVWIPLALLMGIAGSVITITYGSLGPGYEWLHTFGRSLVLQGMFVGLIVGVGSLALPLMTRGEAPPDAAATAQDRAARLANVAGGAFLIASFWIEATRSLRGALLLRAAIILAAFAFDIELWRKPQRPGWSARVIWTAAWMVPLGYLLAALFPMQYRAGLHVTFIGGFALLGLVVSAQVTLGHGGYSELMLGKPWQLAAIGALMLAATIPRAAMEFDPRRFFLWMGCAAFLFLAATLVWAAFLVPKLVNGRK